MARYVIVRMTVEQATAAENACDLIRDSHEADGERRLAGIYTRAAAAISDALRVHRAEIVNARRPQEEDRRRARHNDDVVRHQSDGRFAYPELEGES